MRKTQALTLTLNPVDDGGLASAVEPATEVDELELISEA